MFPEIAPYYISGSICLVLGIVLLSLKPSFYKENLSFRRIKQFVAACAFIEVLVDCIVIACSAQGFSLFALDQWLVPTAYCLQLFLITKALLGMIYSPTRHRLFAYIFFISLFTIQILYLIGYSLTDSSFGALSLFRYLDYTQCSFAKVLSYIFYGMIFLEFCFCVYILLSKTRRYMNRLSNFFSEVDVSRGQKLGFISYCFLSYFILAALDFILSSKVLDPVFMLLNTTLFLYFILSIINLEGTYMTTKRINEVNYEKQLRKELIDANEVSDLAEKLPENELKFNIENRLNKALQEWIHHSDKPYLKDGITLSDVAGEINATTSQLSYYLNNLLHINFCTFINQLRIKESQSMIEENPQLSFTIVSEAVGFSDLPSFSKAFKKITGKTPSEYRNQC